MRPFDHFIAVDWSSRAKPSPRKPTKDAIWVAQSSASGRTSVRYFRTRAACCSYLEKRLVALMRKGQRVLVGWDFSFGYPKGLAKALKLSKKPAWRSVWKVIDELIEDNPDNANNRFLVGSDLNCRARMGSGPFWGVPSGQSGIFLGSKKDFSYPCANKRTSLDERRLVEKRCPKMQPAWKLAYTGSVGSQALLGIPRVLALTHKHPFLKECAHVWPFTTKFGRKFPEDGRCVVHVEIYPSMLSLPGKDKIVDREQVKTYVNWLKEQQNQGSMAGLFAGPEKLSKKERRQVVRHEGWVFGIH